MSHLYFLKPISRRGDNTATKVYKYQEDGTIKRISSYGAGKRFFAQRVPTSGAEIKGAKELHEIVKKAGGLNNFFCVRGDLQDSRLKGGNVNRRYKSTSKNPDWKACNQRWAMLDIDGMDLPGFFDPVDVEGQKEVVQYVKSLLPEWLSRAGCTYHWSSSAGLTKTGDGLYEPGWDKISLHMWFWFDRPVSGFSLRKHVKRIRKETDIPLDASPFNPVQPHYTANPVFKNGEDVIEERTGYCSGESAIAEVPSYIVDLEAWNKQLKEAEEARKARIERAKARGGLRVKSADDAYVAAAVRNSVRKIINSEEGQRHFAIYSGAAGIGELAAYIDNEEAVKEKLKDAGRQVLPASRFDEVDRTVEDGFLDGSKTPREIPPLEPTPTKGFEKDWRSSKSKKNSNGGDWRKSLQRKELKTTAKKSWRESL